MQCPACDNELNEVIVGDIKVDVCKQGCGGIWFDIFELKRVDEKHEATGEMLLDIEKNPNITVDHSKKRNCPKCKNTIMMRHFFSVKREVEVDECPRCGGFWLDSGELGKIRKQFDTEDARRSAAKNYFSDVFGSDLEKMKQQSEQDREKARRVARMFRFICPSYYIPGKQDWGAF
jgi:Zn-finger nucleic acid-binding protein